MTEPRTQSQSRLSSPAGKLYVPLVGLPAAFAIAAIGSTATSTLWIVGIMALVIAASFLFERLAPYEPAWNQSRSDRKRDVAHVVVNETSLVGALVAISAIGLTDRSSWPNSLPYAIQLFGSLLILDAGITVVHALSHRYGSLWRFHAVHHSVRRFYGLNGLMKHPVHQLIEAGMGMTPLLLLGIPDRLAAVLSGLVALQLIFQHGNVDVRLGRAGNWLALAPGHRLHHLRYPREGDVNFGLFTLIWDRMLRSYRPPSDRQVVDGDLGLVGEDAYPDPYIDQLMAPFVRA